MKQRGQWPVIKMLHGNILNFNFLYLGLGTGCRLMWLIMPAKGLGHFLRTHGSTLFRSAGSRV